MPLAVDDVDVVVLDVDDDEVVVVDFVVLVVCAVVCAVTLTVVLVERELDFELVEVVFAVEVVVVFFGTALARNAWCSGGRCSTSPNSKCASA